MNIALDYDDTFTADKQLWEPFVFSALQRGHDIRFVTFRFEHPNGYSNDDIRFDSARMGIPVIFCDGVQKDVVTRDLGFVVDIWIDDFPLAIPEKESLVKMAEGCRIHDDRRKCQKKNPTHHTAEQIKNPQYSEEPLQIGF